MSSQIGRNDDCSCGSGKKYKNCCQKRGFILNKKTQNKIVIGALLGVALIAVVVVFSKNSSQPALQQRPVLPSSQQSAGTLPSGTQTAQTGYTPQPPGPAPAGKVWAPEHGHWHDVQGNVSTANLNPSNQVFDISPNQLQQQNQTSNQTGFTPQPPGPAPAGKVWAPEHGHWHDAPGVVSSPSQNPNSQVFDITPGQLQPTNQPSTQTGFTPQPPGPAPAGKVWAPEHGHWHDAPVDAKIIEVKPSEGEPAGEKSDPK